MLGQLESYTDLVLLQYGAAKYILANPEKYNVTWGAGFTRVFGKGGTNFMLSGDGPSFAKQRQLMGKFLYKDQWKAHIKAFYEDITRKLLDQYSYNLAGVNQVDIIRE